MFNKNNHTTLKLLHTKLYSGVSAMELVIGVITFIPIVLATINLVTQMFEMDFSETNSLSQFLYLAFEIIIAVEFLKLIFVHTINTTVEIIIMAIVRQIIIEHTTPIDTIILVVAIGIMCLVRKYLFVQKLDKVESERHEHHEDKLQSTHHEIAEKHD